jgi:hypothetical protein
VIGVSVQEDSQIQSTPDEEELQALREQLRAHRGRLRALELQAAKYGDATDPHIVNEIAEIRALVAPLEAQLIRATPAATRTVLLQARQQAMKAFYSQQWAQAEELLAQVLQSDPDDTDLQKKLEASQRHLELQAAYQAIRELRAEGLWQAVLGALEDLAQQQADYPDSDGLRQWAEARQRQEQLYERARAATASADWAAAIGDLTTLLAEFPTDVKAKKLLAQVQAEQSSAQLSGGATSPADGSAATNLAAPVTPPLAAAAPIVPASADAPPLLDRQRLLDILSRYKEEQGYYVAPNISADKLATIKERLQLLPADAEILGYIVTTMWGGVGDGVAFTATGVVWRNGVFSTPTDAEKHGYATYDSFPDREFSSQSLNNIFLAPHEAFNHSGWCTLTSEQILGLLNDIKALAAESRSV